MRTFQGQTYLNLRETAALVGYHPDHLSRLVSNGHFITGVKFGRNRLFKKADIDAFLSEKLNP